VKADATGESLQSATTAIAAAARLISLAMVTKESVLALEWEKKVYTYEYCLPVAFVSVEDLRGWRLWASDAGGEILRQLLMNQKL
jgi:hypothetical protein